MTSVLNQSYRADIQIEVINPIEFSGQPAIEVRKDVPDKSDRVHEQDCAQIRVNIAKVTKNKFWVLLAKLNSESHFFKFSRL